MSRINFNFSPPREVLSPVTGITNSIENVTGIFDKIMGIAILIIFAVLLLIIFIFGPGEPIPEYGIAPGKKIGKIVKGSFFKNIIPSWYKEYDVYEQRIANGNRWNYYLNMKNTETSSGYVELQRNSLYRMYDGDYIYFNNQDYTLYRDDKLKNNGLTVSVTF